MQVWPPYTPIFHFPFNFSLLFIYLSSYLPSVFLYTFPSPDKAGLYFSLVSALPYKIAHHAFYPMGYTLFSRL